MWRGEEGVRKDRGEQGRGRDGGRGKGKNRKMQRGLERCREGREGREERIGIGKGRTVEQQAII